MATKFLVWQPQVCTELLVSPFKAREVTLGLFCRYGVSGLEVMLYLVPEAPHHCQERHPRICNFRGAETVSRNGSSLLKRNRENVHRVQRDSRSDIFLEIVGTPRSSTVEDVDHHAPRGSMDHSIGSFLIKPSLYRGQAYTDCQRQYC